MESRVDSPIRISGQTRDTKGEEESGVRQRVGHLNSYATVLGLLLLECRKQALDHLSDRARLEQIKRREIQAKLCGRGWEDEGVSIYWKKKVSVDLKSGRNVPERIHDLRAILMRESIPYLDMRLPASI